MLTQYIVVRLCIVCEDLMLFCIKEVGLYWYSSIRLNMDSGLVYIFRSNYFILNINNI